MICLYYLRHLLQRCCEWGVLALWGQKAVSTQAVEFRLDSNLLTKWCTLKNILSLSFLI